MLPIRVLVADDHKLFRQGLISLMRTRSDLVEIVGEASTGEDAIEMASYLQPDVILMDIAMPHGDGLQATACITEHFPNMAVVILTASESSKHLQRAMEMGAVGYLLKDLDAAELFEMLQDAANGEVVMTKAMGARILKQFARGRKQDETEPLTSRENEVIQLVAKGHSNNMIAEELVISVNTVKVHLRNIMDKLNVQNRTEAVAHAIHCGLVEDKLTYTD